LAVPYDIAGSQVKRAGKEMGEGYGKLAEGDAGGSLDMFMGLMKLYVFTNTPMGDANAQKVLELAIDAARGEDTEEGLKRLNPIKER